VSPFLGTVGRNLREKNKWVGYKELKRMAVDVMLCFSCKNGMEEPVVKLYFLEDGRRVSKNSYI